MNFRATFANTLWWASNLPAWLAYQNALSEPAKAQARVLQSILRAAAQTAFGREHGFSQIRTSQDYARRVPLHDYAMLEPRIHRVRDGESSVLTGDAVRSLATTSGTTSGRKLIPYTRGLQRQFNRAISPWIVDLFHNHPTLMHGPAYWSISPGIQSNVEERSVVPIGFEDDGEYLGIIRRTLVNAVMAVPTAVRQTRDIQSWRDLSMRHLRAAHDLRLISIWHPSFLSLLLGESHAEATTIWPKLRLISCWSDAHAQLAARALADQFPGVVIQPKGLIATEGIVSIPFAGQWPLAIRSHFFEFISETADIALAHELEQGKTYEVVLTTAGGLYRYRLGDLVRVDGFVRRTPSIRFVGRSGNVCDRFGDKLAEPFVIHAIATLQTRLGVQWSFAMLAPDGPRYTLYVQGPSSPEVAWELERLLRENPHYAYCRDLGQLQAAAAIGIPRGADEIVIKRLAESGRKIGDIKPVSLSQMDGWTNLFERD